MSTVVRMPPPRRPSFSEIDKDADAERAGSEAADAVREGPEVDIDRPGDRAQAVRGALSTLDLCACTGREFWAICDPATYPLYLAWARRSLTMLQDIVAEGEKL